MEVTVQDGRILANGTQPDGAPIEERVVGQVRALEAWYAAEFERRLAKLTEVFKTQLQIQVEELQQHYDRRTQAIQEKAQTTVAAPANLLQEIQRTEAAAQQCSTDLERMVGDDTVNLGLLLQKRNQQMEVKAYLRGLKFSVDGEQASPPNRTKR